MKGVYTYILMIIYVIISNIFHCVTCCGSVYEQTTQKHINAHFIYVINSVPHITMTAGVTKLQNSVQFVFFLYSGLILTRCT